MPTVGLDLFFGVGLSLPTGALNDELDILFAEFAEARIALKGCLESWQLFGTDMSGLILAIDPGLQPEVGVTLLGPAGSTIGGEFTPLHGLDLSHLGEDLGR